MSEYYPVLKIPEEIKKIIGVGIPEVKHIRYTPLHTDKLQKPREPQIIKPKKLKFILIGLGLFCLSILAPLPGGVIMLVLGLTIAVFIYFNNELNYARKKAEYNSALKRYIQEVEQWQKQELSRNATINQRSIVERNEVIASRQQKFQLLKVLSPIPGSNAPKGRAESDFLKVLNKFFPVIKILTDYKAVKYVEYPYTPDFIFHFPEWNLYIDIEIDEPYDAKKKKPTHCIDVPLDRERDNFFLQKNWVVIRFAELQVIESPESCCKFIATVVNKLTGQPIPEELKNTPKLNKVARWNIRIAKRMARKNYRRYY